MFTGTKQSSVARVQPLLGKAELEGKLPRASEQIGLMVFGDRRWDDHAELAPDGDDTVLGEDPQN